MRKKIFLTLMAALLIGLFCYGSAQAQSLGEEIHKQNQVFSGENGAGLMAHDPRILAAQIIKLFLTFLSTLFIVYITYAGFLVLTAAGEEEPLTKAKSIFKNGTLGIILVLTAYSIAWLVFYMIGTATVNPFDSSFRCGVTPNDGGFHNPDRLANYVDPVPSQWFGLCDQGADKTFQLPVGTPGP